MDQLALLMRTGVHKCPQTAYWSQLRLHYLAIGSN